MKLSFLLLGIVAAGCGVTSGAAPRPVVLFPGPAELAAVEAKQMPVPSLGTAPLPADGWTVDAAAVPPSAAEPWTARDAWDQAFVAALAVSGSRARPSRALSCAAAETGRFVLRHHKMPSQALRTFIAGACNAALADVTTVALQADLPDGVSAQQVLAHFRPEIGPGLVKSLPANATDVGFWVGRHAGRWVAMMTSSAALAEVRSFSPLADAGGVVTIEGRMLRDTAHLVVMINHGLFGVVPCNLDPALALPQFRVSCGLDAADQMAWLSIMYQAPNTVLLTTVAQVLARRDSQAPLIMKDAAVGPAAPTTSAPVFRAAVVARLNGVRAQAGLPPVQPSDGESDAAARVAAPYFAAALGNGQGIQTMDTIALGIMAGWQVVGTIREGAFFSSLSSSTDPVRWLDEALIFPMGRHVLLARDFDQVALGPVFMNHHDGVGVLAAGYRLQHGNDHRAEAAQLLARITEERARRHLPPPVLLDGIGPSIDRQLALVQANQQTPSAAMNEVLLRTSQRYQSSVAALEYETLRIEDLPVPPQLLQQANLRLGLGITHVKPAGAAWAQLVIVIVYVATPGVSI